MTEKQKVIKALISARAEFPSLTFDKKGQFGNPYSSIEQILECIMEPLLKYGLFPTYDVNNEKGILKTCILHESGEVLENTVPLVPEKSTPHAMAGAITYARRYGICCLLNLAAREDEDDDGTVANQSAPLKGNQNRKDDKKGTEVGKPLRESQIEHCVEELKKMGVSETQFFKDFKLLHGWKGIMQEQALPLLTQASIRYKAKKEGEEVTDT